MARCFEAKKSKAGKKIQCGRCQAEIKPGDKYYFFSVGFRGAKQIRCKDHHPRPSELCGSKMSGAYAANEGLEADITAAISISDISSALETAAGEIEQVRDEYQESYDSLPENFQNGEQGETIQSNIDELDQYATSLNDAASEVSDMESADDSTEGQSADEKLQEAKDRAEEVLGEFTL